jgi:hypothetical protein
VTDDGPISAQTLFDSALRPTPDGVFVVSKEERTRLWAHCQAEAKRLNHLLATDEVLQAKLRLGAPFSCSITEPGLRPYVSHVLHIPDAAYTYQPEDPHASA